jgi:hypothetical protein
MHMTMLRIHVPAILDRKPQQQPALQCHQALRIGVPCAAITNFFFTDSAATVHIVGVATTNRTPTCLDPATRNQTSDVEYASPRLGSSVSPGSDHVGDGVIIITQFPHRWHRGHHWHCGRHWQGWVSVGRWGRVSVARWRQWRQVILNLIAAAVRTIRAFVWRQYNRNGQSYAAPGRSLRLGLRLLAKGVKP